MYLQKLAIAQLENSWIPNVTLAKAENASLAALWVLADKFDIPGAQNAVIDSFQLIQRSRNTVPLATIPYVYENTSTSSALRRYLVALCATRVPGSVFETHPQRFQHALLIDIVAFLKKVADESNRKFEIASFYVPVRETTS